MKPYIMYLFYANHVNGMCLMYKTLSTVCKMKGYNTQKTGYVIIIANTSQPSPCATKLVSNMVPVFLFISFPCPELGLFSLIPMSEAYSYHFISKTICAPGFSPGSLTFPSFGHLLIKC